MSKCKDSCSCGAGSLRMFRGPQGPSGEAATIQVGTVTFAEAPDVINVGTDTHAVFDFVLPIRQTPIATATTLGIAMYPTDGDLTIDCAGNVRLAPVENLVEIFEQRVALPCEDMCHDA